MKVLNRTSWRTDHLRAFARRVAADTIDPEHRKDLLVEFVNARKQGVSGKAFIGLVRWNQGPLRRYGWVRYARLVLPTGRLTPSCQRFVKRWGASSGEAGLTPEHQTARQNAIARWTAGPNKRALAAVLAHEMLHTVGLRHPAEHNCNVMKGHYSEDKLDRWAWADDLPLDLAQ